MGAAAQPMPDLVDQVHAERSGGGDLVDQVHQEATKDGFFSSIGHMLNPVPALKAWWQGGKGPFGGIGDAVDVLHKVHTEAAADPSNAGKHVREWKYRDLTPEESAILEKGNSDATTGLNPMGDILSQFTGPAATAEGQAAEGNVAGAAGSLVGGYAIPAAAGGAARLLRGRTAPAPVTESPTLSQRLYQGALNPRVTTDPSEVRSAVQTGLENKIPVTEAGVAKLNSIMSDLNNQITQKLTPAAESGMTIAPRSVAARLNDVEKRVRAQVNPEADVKAVKQSGDEFLRNQPDPIPVDTAQALKVGTYRKLSGKYGEMATDAQVESQKALARGIKEELTKQIPELADLNAKEGSLFDLQGPLESAVTKAMNRSGRGAGLMDLATGGAVGGLTGSGPLGMAAGVMNHILQNPAVRSRLAIAINQARRQNPARYGRPGIAASMARVDAYANSLTAASQARQDPLTAETLPSREQFEASHRQAIDTLLNGQPPK